MGCKLHKFQKNFYKKFFFLIFQWSQFWPFL